MKPEGNGFLVPAALRGRRLEAVLEELVPGVRRSALRDLCRAGRVLVNGSSFGPARRVRAGDWLSVDSDLDSLPRHLTRGERLLRERPPVLYEDAGCLVLDKPPGISTVPGRRGEPSLHAGLAEWFAGQDLRVVHRLDRDTSGACVFARGVEAARAFDLAFGSQRVDKRYLAFVRGRPREQEFACEVPIGRTIRGGRVKIGEAKGSRPARTEFRTLELFRGFALVEARPKTGRMHQVRAHLARLGFPLAVDPLYGGASGIRLSEFKSDYRARRSGEERPLVARLTLHAAGLEFESPASGERVMVESPLAADLRVLHDKLGRFAADADAEEP